VKTKIFSNYYKINRLGDWVMVWRESVDVGNKKYAIILTSIPCTVKQCSKVCKSSQHIIETVSQVSYSAHNLRLHDRHHFAAAVFFKSSFFKCTGVPA
jgi:hypothetical protein